MDHRTHWLDEPAPAGLADTLDEIRRALAETHRTQTHILQELKRMTKATDDLAAAMTALTTAVTATVTEIQTLAAAVTAGSQNDDSAAVEDAASKITALAGNLTDAVAQANAALPPVQQPTPPAPGQ